MKARKLETVECSSRYGEGKKKKGKQKALVNKYNKHPPCIAAVTKC